MLKARIKETGEIVEVINYSKHNHCVEYGGNNSLGEYETKSLDEVELILDEQVDIDREERRYEITKDILAYMHSCVEVANVLIEELRGGKQWNGIK